MKNASVSIISFGDRGVAASAAAGRISTGAGTALEAFAKSGDSEKDVKLIGKVLSSGHNTIIEHMYVTVAFNDVSVLTEQMMIEHRLAAYTVKSRRYVDFSGAGYLVPEELGDREPEFRGHMDYLFGVYDRLLGMGVPKEDARFVLPYCFRSNFIMSADMREILHVAQGMVQGRLSVYPEIRRLGQQLLDELTSLFPAAPKAIGKAGDVKPLKGISGVAEPHPAAPGAEIVSSTPDAAVVLRRALALNGRDGIAPRQLIRDERPRELEMLDYTFIIKDVSLAGITHFTRHRIQSLIVPRPMDALVSNAYVLPESVASNAEAKRIYVEAFGKNALAARAFMDRPELMSYFALAGNTLDIMLSMNARELLHFLRLRTCTRAQWEIRALSNEMLCLLTEEYRELFRCYGPSCAVLGYCPEGRLSCGKPRKAEDVDNG
ncbi:MAG: FAD-dependent thymidylate synthase [Clostridia bacterium]|nr:FAD-dependent thymidylate synthase [Clostridia bacterium]